ncbi:MAG: SDR family NAD(P)-dependent oxidoreductase [Sinimarinibacterium sp.]|jgi:NAD(P)-dependent dehydrogenase (short-subunit alcohol dehydrogenase family)
MDIRNTSALISGGVSGLGEAVARALVARGARVVAIDLDARKGEALAAELGGAMQFQRADVCSEAEVGAAVARAAALAPLRICVNCAGVAVPPGRTVGKGPEPYPLERFRKAVEVNLVGTFNVARLAATEMARQAPYDESGSRGVIINTASIAAFDGQTGQIAYAAAKAGVAGMTLPLARDLSSIGVRACTVAPGLFDTPMLRQPGMSAELIAQATAALTADNVHPVRAGRPEEFAALVVHVVENDMLNGETLRLDAGARLRANPNRR